MVTGAGVVVVVVVVDGVLELVRTSSIGTGFLMAGADSRLKIGCIAGTGVASVAASCCGNTLLVAGRSSRNNAHRAHV